MAPKVGLFDRDPTVLMDELDGERRRLFRMSGELERDRCLVENDIAVDDRCGDESLESGSDESFGGRGNRFDGFEKRSVIDGRETESVL